MDCLNRPATMLVDSRRRYARAARIADDPDVVERIDRTMAEREKLLTDIRSLIISLHGAGERNNGTFLGAAHKAFLNVRSLFDQDERASLGEVLRGERYLCDEIRKAIRAAIREYDGHLLGKELRPRWVEESKARAAGIGIFLDPWCTGNARDNDARSGGKRYLEHWRPWCRQRGKQSPVDRFAELYFEAKSLGPGAVVAPPPPALDGGAGTAVRPARARGGPIGSGPGVGSGIRHRRNRGRPPAVPCGGGAGAPGGRTGRCRTDLTRHAPVSVGGARRTPGSGGSKSAVRSSLSGTV